MGNLYDKTVDTTNKLLANQNRGYYKNNIRRMESKPIFCTYYNISNADSTVSKGMGQVNDFISEKSPVRYNKINNVPIYAFKEFNRETRKTDIKGITIELDNEGLIPSSFNPLTGDFLIIAIPSGPTLLFKVTVADPTNVLQDPHYRLRYTYYAALSKEPEKFAQLDKQCVNEYDFVLTNVGDNKASLLDIGTIAYIKRLVAVFGKLNREYLEAFYDDTNNLLLHSHVCEDNPEHPIDMIYYSPLVVEFQRRLRPIMYEFTKTYSQELILTHEDMTPFSFEDSMYADLIYDDLTSFLGLFMRFKPEYFDEGGKYLTLMKWFPTDRYMTTLNIYKRPDTVVMCVGLPSDKTAEYIIKNSNNKPSNVRKSEIDNFKKAFEKKLDADSSIIAHIQDIIENPKEILDICNEIVIENTLEYYMLMPIVLYLLRNAIEGSQRDPSYLLDDAMEV